MFLYNLELHRGHMLVAIGDKRGLLDTGSPVSIGSGSLEFGGVNHRLNEHAWTGGLNDIRELAGFSFDALIGGDILSGHIIEVDPSDGKLVVDGPVWDGPNGSVSVKLMMNVPIVDIEIGGDVAP